MATIVDFPRPPFRVKKVVPDKRLRRWAKLRKFLVQNTTRYLELLGRGVSPEGGARNFLGNFKPPRPHYFKNNFRKKFLVSNFPQFFLVFL